VGREEGLVQDLGDPVGLGDDFEVSPWVVGILQEGRAWGHPEGHA
jgi:hypothetical protein